MSILIKGMKLPKHSPAWVVIHHDGTIELNDGSGWWTAIKDGAIEVKAPHGRLIDADAILQEKGNKVHMVMGGDYLYHETIIQNAPTIIEAERTK